MASRDIAGYVSPQWRPNRKGRSLGTRAGRINRLVDANHEKLKGVLPPEIAKIEGDAYGDINAAVTSYRYGSDISEATIQALCLEYLRQFTDEDLERV